MDPPDTFSCVLPLPFRLQGELVFGLWLWALNLHGFHLLGIDIFGLIRYPERPDHHEHEPPLHESTYRLAAILSALWTFALVLFWTVTWGNPDAVIAHQWIPNILLVVMLAVVFAPRPGWTRSLYGSVRNDGVMRLLGGLRRIAFGGIAGPKPEKFGDVLLADAMTSYAKPISEVFVTLCMLLTSGSTTSKPDRLCGHELVVPLAIAWPFLIRFRQCLTEGQRLNALKYATAFPVIILSTMARAEDTSLHFVKNLASITNSLYSFWWDVTMDWDLTLLMSPGDRHTKPLGLRHQRVFQPMAYYVVVAFDLVLRFAWSWKLSLALVYLDGIEGGIAILEVLELTRRWVWVYFRVETEFVRAGAVTNQSNGSIAL